MGIAATGIPEEKRMKSTLCPAVFAVFVAGCAAPQTSTGTAGSAAPSASAYYCAKDRLNVNGANLECNWQPTMDEACRLTKSRSLERGSLAADPQPAGRCNAGQWLVKAVPR
jgi:hypothetical protein